MAVFYDTKEGWFLDQIVMLLNIGVYLKIVITTLSAVCEHYFFFLETVLVYIYRVLLILKIKIFKDCFLFLPVDHSKIISMLFVCIICFLESISPSRCTP